MEHILLVSESKNFIVSSLVKQLEEQNCKVIQATNDPVDMEVELEFKLKDNKLQLILLYAEEEAVKTKGLVYIKDKAIEEDIPIFVIGDVDEMRAIKEVIPETLIKKEFLRPVTIKKVIHAINEQLLVDIIFIKKKVLVVDDSGAMLRNVKGWLEDKYQVIPANSGAMAIKYLAMNQPDLVLLDYEMPICDGKQVLEMIRSEADFSDIPVIFLTGKNDRESVMKVTELKPEGYLLKSMEPAQIVQAIDDFFDKQSL